MSTDSREFENIEKTSLSSNSKTSEMKSITKIDENPLEFNFSEYWNSTSTLTSMQILYKNSILLMSFTDGRIRIMSLPNLNQISSNIKPVFLFDFQSNCDYNLSVLHFHVSQQTIIQNLSSLEFEIITYNSRNILSHWKIIVENKKNIPQSFNDENSNVLEHSSVLEELSNNVTIDSHSNSIHSINNNIVNNGMSALNDNITEIKSDIKNTAIRQGNAFHVGVSKYLNLFSSIRISCTSICFVNHIDFRTCHFDYSNFFLNKNELFIQLQSFKFDNGLN